MPKQMEADLKKRAEKKLGTQKSKKALAYIYGTLRKTGRKPSRGNK